MALTLPEALKHTRNPAMGMIAKAIATTDAFGAIVPFQPIDGTAVPVPREGTLPTTGFIGDDGVIDDVTNGTDDVVHVPVRRIVGDLDVDALADDLTGASPGSQRGRQVQKKVKATWRKIKDKLVNGAHVTSHALASSADPFAAISGIDYGPWLSSARRGPGSIKYTHAGQLWQFRAPGDVEYGTAVAATTNGTYLLRSWNESYFIRVTLVVASATGNGETLITFSSSNDEFDGLIEMCDPGQLIDPTGANGDDFSLNMLDKMLRYLKVRTNRAFTMNSAMVEKYYAKLRAMGGASPQMINLPPFSEPVPSYRGVPILENDNCGLNESVGSTTTATSLYLASLDADEGLSLAAAGGGSFDADGDPRSRIVLGFRIEDVGLLEGKDHRRTRVKWYGAPVLKSKLALVRYRGVKSADV